MGKDLDNVHNKADDNYASQAVRCGAVASVLSVGLDKTLPALQSAAVAAIKKKVWAPAAQTPSNCDKVMRVVEYQRKSPLISIWQILNDWFMNGKEAVRSSLTRKTM